MARRPTNGLVKPAASLPADMSAFEAHAEQGAENIGSADILIPRLTIAQKMSPQVDKDHSAYIEGVEVGDIINVGTEEILVRPVRVIPVYTVKKWLEWHPRESGGGLAGIHDTDACLDGTTENDRGQPVTASGTLIAETHQLFVLRVDGDEIHQEFIGLTSTQIKKARKLNTMAKSVRVKKADGTSFMPPLWYSTFDLDTAHESNASGSWYGWKIAKGPILPEIAGWQDKFDAAVAFYELLKSGEAQADNRDPAGPEPAAGASDDEVPF